MINRTESFNVIRLYLFYNVTHLDHVYSLRREMQALSFRLMRAHLWFCARKRVTYLNSYYHFFAFEEEGGGEGWMSLLTLITLDYRQTYNNIIAALLNEQRWKKWQQQQQRQHEHSNETRKINPFPRNECNVKMQKKSITIIRIPAQINQMCICIRGLLLNFTRTHTQAYPHRMNAYQTIHTSCLVWWNFSLEQFQW